MIASCRASRGIYPTTKPTNWRAALQSSKGADDATTTGNRARVQQPVRVDAESIAAGTADGRGDRRVQFGGAARTRRLVDSSAHGPSQPFVLCQTNCLIE